eukprot:s594_g24.t1
MVATHPVKTTFRATKPPVLVHACDRRRRARRKAGRVSWVSKVSRGSQESPTRTVAASATEKHEYLEVLGVPLTPDFSAVGLAYFAQGALALAALAKPFYVKDTLGLSPADATVFLSLTYWPWIMKPLWGFIADSIPIFGSRRQAYLVLSGLVSVIGWLGLAGWWPIQATKEAEGWWLMRPWLQRRGQLHERQQQQREKRTQLFHDVDQGASGLAYMSSFENAVLAEYVWLDAKQVPRSKTMTMTTLPKSVEGLRTWNYDGSSTEQADGHNSEIYLYPKAIFKDPFRGSPHILVLAEAYNAWDGQPATGNTRADCAKIMEKYADMDPWFGIEQEYTLMRPGKVGEEPTVPLGFNVDGSEPAPQGPYYTGAGGFNLQLKELAHALRWPEAVSLLQNEACGEEKVFFGFKLSETMSLARESADLPGDEMLLHRAQRDHVQCHDMHKLSTLIDSSFRWRGWAGYLCLLNEMQLMRVEADLQFVNATGFASAQCFRKFSTSH